MVAMPLHKAGVNRVTELAILDKEIDEDMAIIKNEIKRRKDKGMALSMIDDTLYFMYRIMEIQKKISHYAGYASGI